MQSSINHLKSNKSNEDSETSFQNPLDVAFVEEDSRIDLSTQSFSLQNTSILGGLESSFDAPKHNTSFSSQSSVTYSKDVSAIHNCSSSSSKILIDRDEDQTLINILGMIGKEDSRDKKDPRSQKEQQCAGDKDFKKRKSETACILGQLSKPTYGVPSTNVTNVTRPKEKGQPANINRKFGKY